MADLRARLGMTKEKSASPARVGVKERDTQACTQLRSKVRPDDSITGSAINKFEMGHKNSIGTEKGR